MSHIQTQENDYRSSQNTEEESNLKSMGIEQRLGKDYQKAQGDIPVSSDIWKSASNGSRNYNHDGP